MNTKKMLKVFKELQAKVAKDGKLDSKSLVVRKLLTTITDLHDAQIEYLEAKAKDPTFRIKFLEGSTKLSDDDYDNLKEAKEINRSIGERLGEIKKAKKKATKK